MNDSTNIEKLLIELGKSRRNSHASWAITIIVYTTTLILLARPLLDENLSWMILVLAIPLAVIVIMMKIHYNTMINEIKLTNNITRERYFENFVKTRQDGNTPLDKFISIAKEVFPQVNIAITDNSKNIVKTKSGLEIIISKNFYGGIAQKIIVEEISDSLTIKKLKNIKQRSVSDKIFRYVVICWDLEECINSKEFEKTMKNTLNVDIFSYKDELLSIEWISSDD